MFNFLTFFGAYYLFHTLNPLLFLLTPIFNPQAQSHHLSTHYSHVPLSNLFSFPLCKAWRRDYRKQHISGTTATAADVLTEQIYRGPAVVAVGGMGGGVAMVGKGKHWASTYYMVTKLAPFHLFSLPPTPSSLLPLPSLPLSGDGQ